MGLALIWAQSRNGIIGADGKLPWNFPEDMKFFRTMTTGHPVIMGRLTHASIGRALPKRRNLVVTSQPTTVAEGCEAVSTIEEAVRLAQETDAMPFCIGGRRLYEAALPLATDLHVTFIDADYTGDVSIPVGWNQGFRLVNEWAAETPGLRFCHYQRT